VHEYLHKKLENIKKTTKKISHVTWGPWASWAPPPAGEYGGFFLRLWISGYAPAPEVLKIAPPPPENK